MSMIKAFICFSCVGAYIGVALAIYALLNKICPYDEDSDILGDGDGNKSIAGFWPVTVPLILICAAVAGVGEVMDLIREYQNRGADNETD